VASTRESRTRQDKKQQEFGGFGSANGNGYANPMEAAQFGHPGAIAMLQSGGARLERKGPRPIPGHLVVKAQRLLGVDLSGVTLEEDPSLAEQGKRGVAEDGQRIRLAPGGLSDMTLIWHEIVHLVQQQKAQAGTGGGGSAVEPDEPAGSGGAKHGDQQTGGSFEGETTGEASGSVDLEAEADRVSAAVLAGEQVKVKGVGSGVLYEERPPESELNSDPLGVGASPTVEGEQSPAHCSPDEDFVEVFQCKADALAESYVTAIQELETSKQREVENLPEGIGDMAYRVRQKTKIEQKYERQKDQLKRRSDRRSAQLRDLRSQFEAAAAAEPASYDSMAENFEALNDLDTELGSCRYNTWTDRVGEYGTRELPPENLVSSHEVAGPEEGEAGKVNVYDGIDIEGTPEPAYALEYKGDGAARMAWVQFVWRELIVIYTDQDGTSLTQSPPSHPLLQQFKLDTKAGYPYAPGGTANSYGKPTEEHISLDVQEGDPNVEYGGTTNYDANSIKIFDAPSVSKDAPYLLRDRKKDQDVEVIERFHAQTYLVVFRPPELVEAQFRVEVHREWRAKSPDDFSQYLGNPVDITTTEKVDYLPSMLRNILSKEKPAYGCQVE